MKEGVGEFWPYIIWAMVCAPLIYVFNLWLSLAFAGGLAAFIATLSLYLLLDKTQVSFFEWVGLSFLAAILMVLLGWIMPSVDSEFMPLF